MKKYDVNEINLKVYDIELSDNQMIIRWTSDIGFGEYTIFASTWNEETKEFTDEKKWIADTEYMDKGEDKEFGKKLLELWMEQIQIR